MCSNNELCRLQGNAVLSLRGPLPAPPFLQVARSAQALCPLMAGQSARNLNGAFFNKRARAHCHQQGRRKVFRRHLRSNVHRARVPPGPGETPGPTARQTSPLHFKVNLACTMLLRISECQGFGRPDAMCAAADDCHHRGSIRGRVCLESRDRWCCSQQFSQRSLFRQPRLECGVEGPVGPEPWDTGPGDATRVNHAGANQTGFACLQTLSRGPLPRAGPFLFHTGCRPCHIAKRPFARGRSEAVSQMGRIISCGGIQDDATDCRV